MIAPTDRRRITKRIATALAVCLAVMAGGFATRNLIADESAHARSFVAEGERALAANDHAAAALAFERARWIAPRAEFVRNALRTAAVQDVEPLVPRALRVLSAREWSALAATCGWISGVGIAFMILRRSRRGVLGLAIVTGVVSVVGMVGIQESNASSPAIVTGPNVHLLIAPYASASAEEVLPSGTMVIVGDAHDDYVRVEANDGAKGWVRQKSVERIADPTS